MKRILCFMAQVFFGLVILCLSHVGGYAQTAQSQRIITGIVLDIEGAPMAGVSVLVKDTNIGTLTDSKGNYSIKLPANAQTIVFSFLGYQNEEVKLAPAENTKNVVLREASQTMENVVVVGYGVQKKVSVTGAISTVSIPEIQTVAAPSLSNSLGGFIPGLTTRQSSGEPGFDSAAIFIRGMGTWINKSPIVFIDGVERSINDINMDEIESISTLKDASATAVYGVRGANGVILITTKRGKMGKPTVSFRTETAVLTGLRFPKYIDGFEYASLMNEGLDNVGNSESNEKWTSEELEKFRTGSDPYLYPNVDWVDLVLRKHTWQTINNLSVSGGNETVRYYVNLGYTRQTGLYKEDPKNTKFDTNAAMNRYNFRSNVDINITKNLVLDLGLGGNVYSRNFPGYGAGDIFSSLKQVSPIAFPQYNPDGTISGAPAAENNPWGLVTQSGYITQFVTNLQSNLGLKWDLSDLVTKGLSIGARYSYDYHFDNQERRYIQYGIYQYRPDETYYEVRPEKPMVYGNEHGSNRATYWEATIGYDRDFGKHSVSGLVLFNRRNYAGLTDTNSTAALPHVYEGLAGRVTYAFDNRYLFEFNAGYNGSENFQKGHRYGFFPSVSAGWILTNEKFWNVDFINNIKIRGSVGKVGNDQVGGRRFPYLSTVTTGGGYDFGYPPVYEEGIQEGVIGVDDLTWEIATKYNVGLDLGFFKNRLTIQADAFFEKRDNILLQRRTVPDYSGFLSGGIPWGNLGKTENKGIDAMVSFRNTTKSGFYYALNANFSFARNKILEIDEPPKEYDYLMATGRRIDQQFGLVAIGFFEDEEDIANSPRQTFSSVVHVGDIKYKDMNGDNVIDQYDECPIGYDKNGIPEIMYGFGGTVGYKGFDLTVHFTGTAHATRMITGASMWPYNDSFGKFNVLKEYYDHRFIVGAADNSKAKYPAVSDGKNTNNFQMSTAYLFDASYLRLKSAEFGYTLPEHWCRKIGLSHIRIFVNGTNLLCFDKIKFMDPEGDNTGGYPLQRTINFGAQLKF